MDSYKNGWLLLCLLALLCGCQNKQKQQKEYDYLIVADIEGCEECQAKLFFQDSVTYKAIDSVANGNGRFSFQGKITQPGFYHIYYFDKVDKTVSGSVQLYLPTDSIHIKATKYNLRTKFYRTPDPGTYLKNTVVFSVAPQQRELEQYLLLRDSLWHQFFTDKALVTAKFTQTFDSGNKALIEQWADSVKSFDYRVSGYWAAAADLFVRQHPASVVSLYAMLDNCNDRPAVERFRRYYQAMPTPLQQSFYGRILDKQLARNENRNQNNQRFIGSYVGRLAGKTPMGKELDVEHLFKRNNLTLVEFWASWCGPCRMEMPKYRRLYQQYNRQGFGMIGVSLDHDYHKWVQAIAEDSLQMPHLSELKGVNGEDIRRFAITGIPANLLVDSTGRIVAVDIPFPKLQRKVQQAL
ncbi:TlpA disulfide reductase family protein [Hymenobacter glacieicola]|nr:TlpA disulfide reductase family protein [Hymenobacter glacieicola]